MKLLTWIFFLSQLIYANPLIDDVRNLRDSLMVGDVSRPALTLRLADLLFDEARLTENKNYRLEAVSLYQESLKDPVTAAHHSAPIRIKFQLARLYAALDDNARATPYWRELATQAVETDIAREANLRLAEMLENQNSPAAIAEADGHYVAALKLCDAADLCAYAHYRHAWLLKHIGRVTEALPEMRLALWDSKGQINEEALRDLIVFHANVGGEGTEALAEIEALSLKLTRPLLMEHLSDAYFSAGNKMAAIAALSHLNATQPTLRHYLRLLEEWYGQRNLDKYHETFARLTGFLQKQPALGDVESEPLLRRLCIQLDGERISQPGYAADFRDAAALHLRLYPRSPERFKMVEGWMAAEKNTSNAVKFLSRWIDDKGFEWTTDETRKLLVYRAAAARSEKQYDLLTQDLKALSTIAENPGKAREYTFLTAVARLESGNQDEALEIAKTLGVEDGKPDSWAIKSENLVLDLLSRKKDYRALVAQADLWTAIPDLETKAAKNEDLKKLVALLKSTKDEARFEIAAGSGTSQEALGIFKEFCLSGRFTPKSCENASVLSVSLKDQGSLLEILKVQGNQEALAEEYEAACFFADAAAIKENRLNAQSDDKAYLKVALLYELADKNADRDRLISKLISTIAKRGSMGELEDGFYVTFKDAGFVQPSLLKLKWNPTNKARLASELEQAGQGNAQTKTILLSAKFDVGPAWGRLVNAEIQPLDVAQRKTHFYGRGSQRKFEARLAAVKKLSQTVEKYFAIAGPETRTSLATTMQKAYGDLAEEILKSPLPEGLDEEAKVQVSASLKEMADPFLGKAQEYASLIIATRATAPQTPIAAEVAISMSKAQATTLLHANPTHLDALDQIRRSYMASGKARMAAYFDGRMRQLKEEEAGGGKL